MTEISISKSPAYRIGAVSKTTGIPVSTLRVWEARYGAFSPVKTEGKQRLFEEHDVSKALLLKQLSRAGHAISTIAGLDLDQLRRMRNETQPEPTNLATPGHPVSLVVVGLGMANRIESRHFATGLKQNQLKVTGVLTDLATASRAGLPDKPHVLLIKVNTLQFSASREIQALIQKHSIARTIVLYHFATEAVVRAMKLSGVIVRREPIADTELAELLQSVLLFNRDRPSTPDAAPTVTAPRQYSEETLSRVAGMSTHVLCECPRHVAELISQLAGFEEYSAECLNKNTDDAHLHAHLHAISGAARALFENALEKIAQHEGIDLNEQA